MNDDRFQRVEELFHRARLLAPADRASYLDEACGGDLELRAEVESLLAHSDRGTDAVSLRGTPPEPDSTLVDRGPPSERPGSHIGPYKILQQIGEGGFGVVYMAEQERPVRRKVALKIIKLGMDTKQVIARFEAERQALALMDHPNIARVLDAGATETGRPYFVMELVRGIPITQYADERRLTTRERLALFMSVCQAIQHAHTKGIIHRDVKPSNVLVTLHDDVPVPKVIDFGIAKATSHRLTEKTLFTEFRQFIGTPEYMSPDQAEISGLDVDTRTDIYSLGVLLYELLTGTTPFDSQTLRTVGHAEIQRIIREVEPPVPSTRVSALASKAGGGGNKTSGSSAAEIAHHRRAEPGSLSRILKGELDWIVMKAMEKDRTRRYQTAHDLVMDIRRFLENEPVDAGPPGVGYRLRKFVRRHRVGAMAGALVALAVVCGLAIATVGFVRAHQEARHSQAVSAFLQSIMEVHTGDGAVSVDQVIARSRELLGDDHAVVGSLLMSHANSLSTAGRLDEAIDAQREAIRFYERADDGDHAARAAALGALAALLEDRRDLVEAEATYREAQAMTARVHGDDSRFNADVLDGLTSMLVETGAGQRDEEVRALWPRTIEAYRASLGDDHRTTVTQLCEYGCWLYGHGHKADAEPVLEKAVVLAKDALGPNDLTYFQTLNALGQNLIWDRGDMTAAMPVIEEMVRIAVSAWGASHSITASLRAQLVFLYEQLGDTPASRRAFEDLLETRRRGTLAPTIVLVATHRQAWAAVESWINDEPELGREFVGYLIDDVRGALSAQPEAVSRVLGGAAEWFVEVDMPNEAEPLQRERVELLRKASTTRPGELADALIAHGEVLMDLKRPEEAEPVLLECLERRREEMPATDWRIASVQVALGHCIAAQQRFDEAETLLLDGFDGLRASALAPDSRRREAMDRLAELYERWGRPEQAAPYREATLEGS